MLPSYGSRISSFEIGLISALIISYVFVSGRTIRLTGSAIVIFSLANGILLVLSKSANFAAVTVIETELDKSSKKLGESTDIDGFKPKLEPKAKELFIVEPFSAVVVEYIELFETDS